MSTVGSMYEMEGEFEDPDGCEGESALEAAFAATRRAEAKSAQELQMELEAIRLRLLRRSQIIDVLRSAYVRDVVVIKNELMRKSGMTDEEYYAQGGPGTDITSAIPSLDMRPVLALFSPEDAFLRIETCSSCGGHLEIVSKETKRVARLNKRIGELNEQIGDAAKDAAHLRAELILTRQRIKELDERNIVNRNTLVAKLEETQKKCAEEVLALKEDVIRSNRAWEGKIAKKDGQLAVVPVLETERDMLRQALAHERASREEELHGKDDEIATLVAKVAQLESSAEADAKDLQGSRTKADETQRKLHAEKERHAATAALLEEEKARYERCRSRLETSQEHLADLNDRFNELRAEIESSAENAEEQAGEASDALAAAKMEVKRLRTVLGTNNAAAALEAATLKVSLLSEELRNARSEAREANNALREVQEELQVVRAEAEQAKTLVRTKSVSTRSDTSQKSEGGLSWVGSFMGSMNGDNDVGDDDLEEDQERSDRMSSALMAGGRRFEKGKWAVEKWISLVRFRKAVNAHTAEVTRLENLLRIAEGGEERSRLTSELQEVSSRYSLEDMEAAMHLEVAALKLQAAGRQSGGGVGAESLGGQINAVWEAKLAEAAKRSKEALANMAALHDKTVQVLREELDNREKSIGKLEAEAVEMKDKLKRLARLEKNEKGHNAMTEELKKMEEETGISVCLDSSLEFASMEGDLSKEDEARLIEELNNAREEIKNIKMRQAMVTHELLGSIKGAHAEVDMLKAALKDMTSQRDARVDMSTLAGMGVGSGLAVDDTKGFLALTDEAKKNNLQTAALKAELKETSGALLKLLEEVRKSSKETTRAKAKVWNARELDRARSIPPPHKPTLAAGNGRSTTGGRRQTAIQRPSGANASAGIDGPSKGTRFGNAAPASFAGDSNGRPGCEGFDGLVEGVGAATVVGGSGGGGDAGSESAKAATEEEEKEAELEKRRQERAAQAAAMKLLVEEEQKDLEVFEEACLKPGSEGVTYAMEKMGFVLKNVKEQFREVFLELKEALEMHKKFVIRSRIESREVDARIAGLEMELERTRALHNTAEEQLRVTSAALEQTKQDLNAERSAGAATRKELDAALAEARQNVYFREKNAVLQKQQDHAEISARRAKQDCEKAKSELREQGANLMELRKFVEESERKAKAFAAVEQALKDEIKNLAVLLGEAESAVEHMTQAQRLRLETLKSTSTQVNGYGDPDLGLGAGESTQTDFHCPRLTLRRSNDQRTLHTRAASAGVAIVGSSQSFRGRSSGLVCPTVDGRAVASERDLYSPGAGSAFLKLQSCGTTGSLSNTGNLDRHSDSLQQLSLCSPAWTMEELEGAGAASQNSDGNSGGRAKHWGLWHEGDIVERGTLVEDHRCSAPTAVADSCAGDGGDGDDKADDVQRPGTSWECRPSANIGERQEKFDRPRTSPIIIGLPVKKGSVVESLGPKETSKSPPRRMNSRLFLQSARDNYLSSAGLSGGGGTGGGVGGGCGEAWLQPRRQGVASAAASTVYSRLDGQFCSSQAAGVGGFAPGPEAVRPSTSSAVLITAARCERPVQERYPSSGLDQTSPDWGLLRGQVGNHPNHEIIDLGVVPDASARPTLWGKRQLEAAADAAAGRTRSTSAGRGIKAGMTKGGIVVDARFAKARNTLRRDVIETAERAGLPLLQ